MTNVGLAISFVVRRWSFVAAAFLLAPPVAAQQKQNPFDVEAREYYGTPKSEESVKRGLDYLAAHQAMEKYFAASTGEEHKAIVAMLETSGVDPNGLGRLARVRSTWPALTMLIVVAATWLMVRRGLRPLHR